MAAEFVIDEELGHPDCAANCHITDMPQTRRLAKWVTQGAILIAAAGDPQDRIIPGVIPGLRSNKAGRLIKDDARQIRGYQNLTMIAVSALYGLAVDPAQPFRATFQGHFASRPNRYGRSLNGLPISLGVYASTAYISALEEAEAQGLAFHAYCLAPQGLHDPAQGFQAVQGGFAHYSSVETEVLGVEQISPLTMLGLGFYANYTDPLTEPVIAEHYRQHGIRTAELD